MTNQILAYIGAGFTTLWGIAHLFPTKSVVRGFGNISTDNRRIITMEWITEGVFLIFIGLLCAGTTTVGASGSISILVYVLSAVFLIIMAIVSLFTGFKVNFLPFKLCPFIFTSSAVLILLGALVNS